MKESISSIAERLVLGDIAEIKSGKKILPNTNVVQPKAEPAGIDISKVDVSRDFLNQILSESFGVKKARNISDPEPKQEMPVVEIQVSPAMNEAIERIDTLIAQLQAMRATLTEMTTAGMMGVNLGGPGLSKNDKVKQRLKLKLKKKR